MLTQCLLLAPCVFSETLTASQRGGAGGTMGTNGLDQVDSSTTRRLRKALLLGAAIIAASFAGSHQASAQTTSAGAFAFPTFCYQNTANNELTCGTGSSAIGTGATAYGTNA